MTRLVIFGAGDDARPLGALARSLGWHVTIVDRRGRLAIRDRFPQANEVLAKDWEVAIPAITFTPNTAVVLMTHSLDDDMEILPLLAGKSVVYLGSLGPEQRRRWLLEAVENRAETFAALASRLRGPIGLDLGERSATGIAVSIVAEILAEMNGRSGLPLSQPEQHASIAKKSEIEVADV
jgi:xanthine/CO dehydrogenase XdhC/CoxF family maturation factor